MHPYFPLNYLALKKKKPKLYFSLHLVTHFVWADHYAAVSGTYRDIKENKRKKRKWQNSNPTQFMVDSLLFLLMLFHFAQLCSRKGTGKRWATCLGKVSQTLNYFLWHRILPYFLEAETASEKDWDLNPKL